MTCTGLLLAAGAGRRYGGPKALAVVDGTGLLSHALETLGDGGCSPIVVVTGAAAAQVESLVPPGVTVVRASQWQRGMGESLRAGMAAATGEAVLVHLVDLPDVGAEVIARIRARSAPDALCRASYRGTPGHPVLVGRNWWEEFSAHLTGDRGAREWLLDRVAMIECADLATGYDLDTPADRA